MLSLWPYKNCHGLPRAFAKARFTLTGHQLVIVGPGRDEAYLASLQALVAELGIADDVLFLGGLPIPETVPFTAPPTSLFTRLSTRHLGCPFCRPWPAAAQAATSNTTAMPETAGGAAILCSPLDRAPAALPPSRGIGRGSFA